MRNIFTGLLFNTDSNDTLLPIGAGSPKSIDYRMRYGYQVGEKRVNNAGNAVVAEYRLARKLAGK